jgi:hypothetical protein
MHHGPREDLILRITLLQIFTRLLHILTASHGGHS